MDSPPPISDIRPRHLLSRVQQALSDRRVVLITGPRQAGKSTLARLALAGRSDARYVSLDDHRARTEAEADPATFVQHSGTLCIDEVQRVPEVLLQVKIAVDRSNQPGQFLLTGSANVLTLPRIADALTGRTEIIELFPFSQGELDETTDAFVDSLFADNRQGRAVSELTKWDYLQRATAGGFPEIHRLSESRRPAWFADYVASLLYRDIPDIGRIQRVDDLDRLLRLLAARACGLYKAEEVSRAVELPSTTVKRYVALLQTAYVVTLMPAWFGGRTARAVHARKLYFVDTGLLAHLLGTTARAAAEPGGPAGQLMENFIAMELQRQIGWSRTRTRQYHFRNRDGTEVDTVLESSDGEIAAIEMKAGATVRTSDAGAIRLLAQKVGKHFATGIVLYTGDEEYSLGSGVHATPASTVWRA